MCSWQIALSDLDYGTEEDAAVMRVLTSKWLSMGQETKAFEEEFSNLTGTQHAVAVASGTAALHLAFLSVGIQSGDEIIQPALNFVAAANMTMAMGATPVFGDIISVLEPTLDPNEIERLITPRSKAVVVMHYGGYPCRMADITEVCRRHKLWLIEDACHAIGAEYSDRKEREPQGRQVGNLGDIACFSFFSNKNLAVGEGGMVTTNRSDLDKTIRHLRSHGMTTLTWERHCGHAATYNVLANGFNYRMDELRSALGRAQLSKLLRNNIRRRELVAEYWERLSPLETKGWKMPFRSTWDVGEQKSGFTEKKATAAHLMAVVAPTPEVRWHCAEALKTEGIQTSLHYPYIPEFTAFRTEQNTPVLSKTHEFCNNVITLPLHPNLKPKDIEVVCDCLICAA